MSLWNIFLRHIYKDIPTVTSISLKSELFLQDIHSKPEILLQSIREFMMLSKQAKSEASKSWSPLYTLQQSYVKFFYKYIGYYVIDQNINNNTCSIRKQTKGNTYPEEETKREGKGERMC